MFDRARDHLDKVRDKFIKKVVKGALSDDFNELFGEQPEVKQLRAIINFFKKHDLIDKERILDQSDKLTEMIKQV